MLNLARAEIAACAIFALVPISALVQHRSFGFTAREWSILGVLGAGFFASVYLFFGRGIHDGQLAQAVVVTQVALTATLARTVNIAGQRPAEVARRARLRASIQKRLNDLGIR